jgi:hypothetical protein
MAAISAFLKLGFVPPEHDLTKGLHFLLPGHALEYRLGKFLSVYAYKSQDHSNALPTETLAETLSRESPLCSLSKPRGEALIKAISSVKEEPFADSIQLTVDAYLAKLPALVWIGEAPFTEIIFPYKLFHWSRFASRENLSPIGAFGENLFFSDFAIHNQNEIYAVPPSKLKALLYRITSYLPWRLSLLFSKPFKRYPWVYTLINTLSPLNKNLFRELDKELLHAFSPRIYLRNFAQTLRENNVPAYIHALYCYHKVPAFDLKLKSGFSTYYQINWQSPLTTDVGVNISEHHALSSNGFIEQFRLSNTQEQKLTEEDKASFSLAFEKLQRGKLVESGIFTRSFIKAAQQELFIGRASQQLAWTLLSLETWFQLFIDKPPPTTIPKLHFLELYG